MIENTILLLAWLTMLLGALLIAGLFGAIILYLGGPKLLSKLNHLAEKLGL